MAQSSSKEITSQALFLQTAKEVPVYFKICSDFYFQERELFILKTCTIYNSYSGNGSSHKQEGKELNYSMEQIFIGVLIYARYYVWHCVHFPGSAGVREAKSNILSTSRNCVHTASHADASHFGLSGSLSSCNPESVVLTASR